MIFRPKYITFDCYGTLTYFPMHQVAYPDEDISDRPEPGTVMPHLLALLEQRPASGRYRAADVDPTAGTAVPA